MMLNGKVGPRAALRLEAFGLASGTVRPHWAAWNGDVGGPLAAEHHEQQRVPPAAGRATRKTPSPTTGIDPGHQQAQANLRRRRPGADLPALERPPGHVEQKKLQTP